MAAPQTEIVAVHHAADQRIIRLDGHLYLQHKDAGRWWPPSAELQDTRPMPECYLAAFRRFPAWQVTS